MSPHYSLALCLSLLPSGLTILAADAIEFQLCSACSQLPRVVTRPVDAETELNIKKCIDDLQQVGSLYGVYPNHFFRSVEFPLLPLAGPKNSKSHNDDFLHLPIPIVKLIQYGPSALPMLSSHLSDKRLTRLSFTPKSVDLVQVCQLPRNPVSPLENQFLVGCDKLKATQRVQLNNREYRMTVGDACFVTMGHIVGRHYAPLIAKSKFVLGVNSPTINVHVSEALKAMWQENPDTRLFELLVSDLSTHSVQAAQEDWPLELQGVSE